MVHVLQNTRDFAISCCLADHGKEMYKESKRTWRTILLLIKRSFSLPLPTGFAKAPCCLAEDCKETHQELQRTCKAIVLLIYSFVQ